MRSARAVLPAALLLVACASVGAAQRPEETRAERDAVEGVHNALEHKDCGRAVSRLNSGLASKYPGIYLMAGTMYEEGLCLKPSWERAERMYRLAHESGHGAGQLRLVAGLAQGTRDRAAALWWAQQTRDLPLPEACRVDERIWGDPELFVATLKLWPASRLDHCVYVAGVMAHVSGDAEYPAAALASNLSGTIDMTYTPASSTLLWRTVETQAVPLGGVHVGERVAEQDSRKTRGSLESHMREVGARALKRFQQPEGIDPSWQLRMQWVFMLSLK